MWTFMFSSATLLLLSANEIVSLRRSIERLNTMQLAWLCLTVCPKLILRPTRWFDSVCCNFWLRLVRLSTPFDCWKTVFVRAAHESTPKTGDVSRKFWLRYINDVIVNHLLQNEVVLPKPQKIRLIHSLPKKKACERILQDLKTLQTRL